MAQKSSAAGRTARRGAKKALRRLHPVTVVVAVLCLAVGVAAGAFACKFLSRNDGFALRGGSEISLEAGAEGDVYLYTEEGVEAVCFGRDVSGDYHAQTTLQKNAAGQYVIPLDKVGVYTVTYTVDCFKFGENAPNGAVRRVRTFTVAEAGEEDGRGE